MSQFLLVFFMCLNSPTNDANVSYSWNKDLYNYGGVTLSLSQAF